MAALQPLLFANKAITLQWAHHCVSRYEKPTLISVLQLLERSQLANEAGAAIHLPPNAHGLVKRLGIEISHIGANKLEWVWLGAMVVPNCC